jgi:hypothetical protein
VTVERVEVVGDLCLLVLDAGETLQDLGEPS